MAFLGGLFGGGSSNLQPAYNNYADQMRQIAESYNPYVNYGNQGLTTYFDQLNKLISNPNFLQDMVSQGFSTSPYQENVLSRTKDIMNMNAASTGMLGSGAANQALQDQLVAQIGQFQNDYIDRGMGSYQTGLSGMQGVAGWGLEGLGQQAGLGEAAALAELKGAQSNAASEANMWGNILGGLGGLASIVMPGGGSLAGMAINKGLSMFKNPKSSTIDLGY